MVALGNLMSFFRFQITEVTFAEREGLLDLDLTTRTPIRADIHASYTVGSPKRALPATSASRSLEEAGSWPVELFAAFDHRPEHAWIDVVRIHPARRVGRPGGL